MVVSGRVACQACQAARADIRQWVNGYYLPLGLSSCVSATRYITSLLQDFGRGLVEFLDAAVDLLARHGRDQEAHRPRLVNELLVDDHLVKRLAQRRDARGANPVGRHEETTQLLRSDQKAEHLPIGRIGQKVDRILSAALDLRNECRRHPDKHRDLVALDPFVRHGGYAGAIGVDLAALKCEALFRRAGIATDRANLHTEELLKNLDIEIAGRSRRGGPKAD